MNCIVILLPRRALHLFSVKGFYPALPATASATPPAEVWRARAASAAAAEPALHAEQVFREQPLHVLAGARPRVTRSRPAPVLHPVPEGH